MLGVSANTRRVVSNRTLGRCDTCTRVTYSLTGRPSHWYHAAPIFGTDYETFRQWWLIIARHDYLPIYLCTWGIGTAKAANIRRR